MERRPILTVLGSGSLGGAVLAGLASRGAVDLRATTRSRDSAARIAALGVDVTALEDDADANARLVADADLVLVAVKPAGVLPLLRGIGPALRPDALVLSAAAGITIASLEAALRPGSPVLRVMTNLPIAVGEGSTAVVRGSAVGDAGLERVRAMFASAGDALVVEESRIDAFTAVAGSGPGLVYWLVERFADQAERLGLPQDEALRLARAVFAAGLADGRSEASAPGPDDEGAIIAAALGAAAMRSAALGAG